MIYCVTTNTPHFLQYKIRDIQEITKESDNVNKTFISDNKEIKYTSTKPNKSFAVQLFASQGNRGLPSHVTDPYSGYLGRVII